MRILLLVLCCGCLFAAQPTVEVMASGKVVDPGSTYHQPMNAPDASVALFSEQRDLFTIRNTGQAPVTISDVQLTLEDGIIGEEFTLQSGAIKPTRLAVDTVELQPGDQKGFSFYVRFYPVHSGERGATVTVSFADDSSLQWRVTGTGRDHVTFTDLGEVKQHKLLGGVKTDEQATGMAVDSQGNAFIYGQATGHKDTFAYDLILAKVTPTGELGWAKLWNGPYRDYARDAGQNDQTGGVADAIAVDAAGDVYVCASVSPASYNNNFAILVMKVSGADGSIIWEQLWRPDWPSSLQAKHNAEGYGLCLHDGRVYAIGSTGAAISGGNAYVCALALDADSGALLWQKAVDPVPRSNDRGYAIAADDSAVYLAGYANNRGFVMKLDNPADPTPAWCKQVNMGMGSTIHSLALGPDGEIYAACDRRGSKTFFTALRIEPDGSQTWAKTYQAAASNQNQATAVVRVAGDKLLVGGRIAFSLLDAQMGDGFVCMRSLADGELLGSMVYYTGKGPDEIQEHRVKGLAMHGEDLLIFGQTYTGNNNGVRYHGYWYDGLGADADDPQPMSDIELGDEQFIDLQGSLQSAADARQYIDAPASLIWQPAVDKHDGHGPDEDLFFMRMRLTE